MFFSKTKKVEQRRLEEEQKRQDAARARQEEFEKIRRKFVLHPFLQKFLEDVRRSNQQSWDDLREKMAKNPIVFPGDDRAAEQTLSQLRYPNWVVNPRGVFLLRPDYNPKEASWGYAIDSPSVLFSAYKMDDMTSPAERRALRDVLVERLNVGFDLERRMTGEQRFAVFGKHSGAAEIPQSMLHDAFFSFERRRELPEEPAEQEN